jgi:hypothetical protein
MGTDPEIRTAAARDEVSVQFAESSGKKRYTIIYMYRGAMRRNRKKRLRRRRNRLP